MKAIPKKTVRRERAALWIEGADAVSAEFTAVIIPDSFNLKTSRWTKAKDEGVLVFRRTDLAGMYRKWRRNGGRAERWQTAFAAYVGWIAEEAVRTHLPLLAKKGGAR